MGLANIRQLAAESIAENTFESREAGGIDWNLMASGSLPRTTRQAIDSPYPYSNVFRFDLDTHCDILWGEDFRESLPHVPPPDAIAGHFLRRRSQRVGTLKDTALGRQRGLYAVYKAAIVLQLVHGELTLDKRRVLDLFVRNVPQFPQKQCCADIVAGYVRGDAVVPQSVAIYRTLIDDCALAV